MSELQQLCETLTEISQDAVRMASGLNKESRSLSEAALRASVVAGSESGNPLGARTVQGLQNAARSARDAAALLNDAAQAGQAFVSRMIGVGSAPAAAGDADPVTGGGLVPPIADRESSTSLLGIQEWLPEINPGYDGDQFKPRSNNCGSCALAVYEKLSGRAVAAAGMTTLSISEMEALTGKKQIPMTPPEIAYALIRQGPGAHAVVGIDRHQRDGHWFNAYYDGQKVVAIDGQSGTIMGWPPAYGSTNSPVTNWDAGI